MMRKGLFHILFLALCLTASFPVSAQKGRWETALDQYEAICDRCIELRTLSLSGQPVSSEALSSLLLQLSSLRQQLQTAEGEMTPAQRNRFILIRNRYQAATAYHRKPSKKLHSLKVIGPDTLPTFSASLVHRNPDIRPIPAPRPSDIHGGIVLFAGLPDGYPGVMGFLQKHRWGGYLKGATTIQAAHPDYTGLSDGTSDGSMVWTSGQERLCRRSASIGAIFSLTEYLRLYAGPQYVSRTVLWEDVSGKWMSVSDLNHKGWGIDTGLVFAWKRISVMAGASYASGCPIQGEFGLGLLF